MDFNVGEHTELQMEQNMGDEDEDNTMSGNSSDSEDTDSVSTHSTSSDSVADYEVLSAGEELCDGV